MLSLIVALATIAAPIVAIIVHQREKTFQSRSIETSVKRSEYKNLDKYHHLMIYFIKRYHFPLFVFIVSFLFGFILPHAVLFVFFALKKSINSDMRASREKFRFKLAIYMYLPVALGGAYFANKYAYTNMLKYPICEIFDFETYEFCSPLGWATIFDLWQWITFFNMVDWNS